MRDDSLKRAAWVLLQLIQDLLGLSYYGDCGVCGDPVTKGWQICFMRHQAEYKAKSQPLGTEQEKIDFLNSLTVFHKRCFPRRG